ncbi:MAG: BON domain-containing protein [Chloroflexi bacterium]|nr:BON domain-containing protein [Chloroflexota bacterium]
MQERSSLSERLERELGDAGIFVAIEDSEGAIVLSGLVDSTEEREAARDIVTAAVSGARRVDVDNVQVSGALPADSSSGPLSEAEIAGFEGADAGLEDAEALDPGDFTDQVTMASSDSMQAASMSGSPSDDPDLASAGDVVYVPPTDPVSDGAGVIGGFQPSSMSSIEVERSSDGTLGDEAIRDTILQEVREDAATSGLALAVSVFRGIVTLTGRVADIDDVEAVEEVTSRVPGVVEVIEELEVEHLG